MDAVARTVRFYAGLERHGRAAGSGCETSESGSGSEHDRARQYFQFREPPGVLLTEAYVHKHSGKRTTMQIEIVARAKWDTKTATCTSCTMDGR